MFEQVTRGARITLFSVALLALSVSVFGQDVSAGGTGGQQSGQAAGSPVVRKLSVDEAVQMALEQNLDLQVERINPRLRDLSIATAKTVWTPNVTSGLSDGNSTTPNYNIYGASGSTLSSQQLQWSFGASQQLPWGGNYQVTWGSQRLKSNNAFDLTNPVLVSTVSATYTQPFLRNLKIDGARRQLLISRKDREISDVQLRQTVLATIRNVKNAYWNLSYYVSSLAVQQQSLDLARESLKNNEARVRIGTMAPIDIIQAQAEVASREEAVIRAQAAVAQAEDQFRGLIMDPQSPNFWIMKFELTDAPSFQAQSVDVDAAVRRALDARTDLVQQKKTLEENDLTLRYLHNQTLPDVNFQAKYSMTAKGGTTYDYDRNGALTGTTVVGYGSVLSSVLRRDLPTWSFAVQVNYPIGNSSAEANLAAAKLQMDQARTQLRAAELSVVTQVRDAARQVMTNQKRVESTRASRELQEKKLEAEQKKFAAGMQTTFFVLQAQRDLAQARNAELQAILDYTRSLVDFETVQQAPTYGGSSGGVTISTGGQ
jgi:outer membrane protein TolC